MNGFDTCRALPDEQRRFVETFRTLLQIPCPGGREWMMAEKITSLVGEMGYQTERDPAGNVLIRLEGSDSDAGPCVFAAHMDEIALVVRDVLDDGTLLVANSGGLIPYKLGERPLQVLGDHETIVALPNLGHGHGGGQFASGVSWQDVTIMTGLSREQLKTAGVRPGTTAVPTPEGRGPLVFGDTARPLLGGWLLDNRAGVAVQLEVLRSLKEREITPRRPVIFAFTVHEEGGCHGAKSLSFREKPEIFIAVDGCPITPNCGAIFSAQPAVWSKDRIGHYDQRMVATFLEAGRSVGIECQTVVQSLAASDASAAFSTGSVPRAGVIGYPKYCSHGCEIAHLAVFQNTAQTILSLLSLQAW